MKAVEAVKENFYCFLGIVHPTVYNTVGEPDYQKCHKKNTKNHIKITNHQKMGLFNEKVKCLE